MVVPDVEQIERQIIAVLSSHMVRVYEECWRLPEDMNKISNPRKFVKELTKFTSGLPPECFFHKCRHMKAECSCGFKFEGFSHEDTPQICASHLSPIVGGAIASLLAA
jgi:hypothetical protein